MHIKRFLHITNVFPSCIVLFCQKLYFKMVINVIFFSTSLMLYFEYFFIHVINAIDVYLNVYYSLTEYYMCVCVYCYVKGGGGVRALLTAPV